MSVRNRNGKPPTPSCRSSARASIPAETTLAVAGCVTISAWTDLFCAVDTYKTRVWQEANFIGDPIFSTGNPDADTAAGAAGAMRYVGPPPARIADPLASPINTPREGLAQLPNLLMMVGDAELMLGDTTEYVARAVEAGADTKRLSLRIFPSMWHCWPMYCEGCGQFPEEAAQRLLPAASSGSGTDGGTAGARGIGLTPAVDALAEVGSFFRGIALP